MSLLDQARKLEQQVVSRLKELEPLTREYDQLRRLAERLGVKYSPGSSQSGDGATSATTAQRPGKRAAATRPAKRRPPKAKAARPRTGARAAKPAAKPRGTRSSSASKETTAAQAKTAPARQRKRAATSGQRSSGRRATARPGQRHEDVLRLVGEHPGITVREIGERLGVDATGLYRVVNRLTDEGRLRKDGARLQPVDPPTGAKAKPKAASDAAKPTPTAAAHDAPEAAESSESEPSSTVAAGAPTGPSE